MGIPLAPGTNAGANLEITEPRTRSAEKRYWKSHYSATPR